ncbi:hypothetical protein SAMN02745127_00967 [Oceanospirillum multiglobuliferum]|uniref:hypothetical protein n=1 Tax=Oceanospirillum multiglobuliferum TaxID=64969 RepID=UPI0009CA8A46|nr:hypothetical protein [Oceanospirillum multiglobuliferum]SJZ73320.1 hypothetical protein SAMN02745127_00967 [Oceanospirillum multiglobuliferum]
MSPSAPTDPNRNDKSNRPSRSPEQKRKRNLSFFITVLAAVLYAIWSMSNGQ